MKWWIEKQHAKQHIRGIFPTCPMVREEFSSWKNLILGSSWSERDSPEPSDFHGFSSQGKFCPCAQIQNVCREELHVANKAVKTRETIKCYFRLVYLLGDW